MRLVYIIITAMTALGLSVAMIDSRPASDTDAADTVPASPGAKQSAHRHEHGHNTKQPGLATPATTATPVEDEVKALSDALAQSLAEPEEQPVTAEEARDEMESAFIDESNDPGWALQAERIAQEKLDMAMPQASALLSVECRSSMCRIETVHRNPDDYGQFQQSAFARPETQIWNAASLSTPLRPDDSGGMVIVSYVAREGRTLPIPGAHARDVMPR